MSDRKRCDSFLFLLVSGKGCGLWLWHSLDFSVTLFCEYSGTMRTPLEGANSIIYAAVNPELKGVSGIYFKDCKNGHTTATARYVWQYQSRNVRKRTFGHVHPVKIQISLRIRAVWSECSLGAFWIAIGAKFLRADNEDSGHTARDAQTDLSLH